MNEFISGFFAGTAQTIVGHPLDTLKVLIQNKNLKKGLSIRELYRGWRYPMAMSTIFNSTLFPLNKVIHEQTNNYYTSGLVSGAIVSPIVFFFDIGKIKEQTNQKLKLEHLYKTRGLLATTLRESLAISLYFGPYFTCKEKYNLDSFIAGGVAGITNWTLTYPIDVVRTRQIAQNISINEAIKQGKLWDGYKVCIMRAIIVNASIFKIYDMTKHYLDVKT